MKNQIFIIIYIIHRLKKMPLIVKPISAMLVKDFDWIGKSVEIW